MRLRSTANLPDDASDATRLQALVDFGPPQLVEVEEDDAFQTFFPEAVFKDPDGLQVAPYSAVARLLLCCVKHPAGSPTSQTWGSSAFSAEHLSACLAALVDAGLTPTRYSGYADFYKDVLVYRPLAETVEVTNASFFSTQPAPPVALEDQPHPTGFLECLPLQAPACALDGFCEALGDLEDYFPNHLLWMSRADDSDNGYMATHLLQHMQWVDHALHSLPPSRVGGRVLSRLQKTLWPASLRQTLCTADQRFDDVSDRMVLGNGSGTRPDAFKELLASRAHTLLCSKQYRSLSSFLKGHTVEDSWQLLEATASLIPASLVSEASLVLDSLEAVDRLDRALGLHKTASERPAVTALSPGDRVRWLERLLGDRIKTAASAKKQPTAATPGTGVASAQVTLDDSDESLQNQFSSTTALNLEAELLTLFEHQPDDFVFTIFDKIVASDQALFKKAALGYIKTTGCRPVLKKLATIQPYWEQWANLRLVWDGSTPATPTPAMRTFTPAPGFWEKVKQFKWAELDILRDVYVKYHRTVLLAPKTLVLPEQPLLDKFLVSQDKLFGDRVYGVFGFPSVERTGAVSDSYAALSDKVSDFWEQGIPLQGSHSKLRKHASYALEFHSAVLAEAALVARVWAKSTDAAHPFPPRFVPAVSPAKQTLERREAQLTKHLEALDYNSTDSEGSEPDLHHRREKPSPKRKRKRGSKPTPALSGSDTDEPKRKKAAEAGRPPKKKPARSPEDRREHNPLPLPADVDIGASIRKVKIVETDTSISLNGRPFAKSDLAAACGVGTDDLCWATSLSSMPWPLCLRLCNHAGEPGHESHDSSRHKFSTEQLQSARLLIER
jgi:hypothetical protein